MAECEVFKELIYPYLDGELFEELKLKLEGHIDNCKSCKELLHSREILIKRLDGIKVKKTPDGFTEGILSALNREERPEAKVEEKVSYLELLGIEYLRSMGHSFSYLQYIPRPTIKIRPYLKLSPNFIGIKTSLGMRW
ncbi:zf-HC2 domain-containing protein [bacterium]|nr:zf-HC2 domain-containing protein [bacterium]